MNSGKVAAVVSLVQSWEQGDIRTGCVYEKYEVLVEDYMVPNVEEERHNVFTIKMNMQIMNKGMTLL